MRRSGLALLTLAASCVGLAACGSSDDGATTASEASTITFVTSGSARAPTISLDGTPTAGLTTIVLRNRGRGDHEAQLVRVEGTHSEAEVMNAFAATGAGRPTAEWLFAAGGTGAPEGATASTAQVLAPGTYYAVDSSGSDERRAPHVRFEVAGEASDDVLPAADATITASEYAFTAGGLRAGANEVTFENAGRQIHHVIALPILPGRTIDDVRAFITDDNPRGSPPFDFRTGASTTALEGGTSENVTLRLRRGDYALVCFISDRQGGPPHALMGMITETTVE